MQNNKHIEWSSSLPAKLYVNHNQVVLYATETNGELASLAAEFLSCCIVLPDMHLKITNEI